jgi:hypothetical protein
MVSTTAPHCGAGSDNHGDINKSRPVITKQVKTCYKKNIFYVNSLEKLHTSIHSHFCSICQGVDEPLGDCRVLVVEAQLTLDGISLCCRVAVARFTSSLVELSPVKNAPSRSAMMVSAVS